jgi:hypothetical protein
MVPFSTRAARSSLASVQRCERGVEFGFGGRLAPGDIRGDGRGCGVGGSRQGDLRRPGALDHGSPVEAGFISRRFADRGSVRVSGRSGENVFLGHDE